MVFSRINLRVLESRPRLPSASAMRALKEYVRLAGRFFEGVKLQRLPLTFAIPRKELPE